MRLTRLTTHFVPLHVEDRVNLEGAREWVHPLKDALESKGGVSPMWLTFRKGEVEQIAGSLMNEGRTGSEHLTGPPRGEGFMVRTGS